MKKRKFPDFLADQHLISHKKAQKWLKNYPLQRLNLDHLIRKFKETFLNHESVIEFFKRLHWQMTIIKNYDFKSYQCSFIAFDFIHTQLNKKLQIIKDKIEIKDIESTYKKLLQYFKNSENICFIHLPILNEHALICELDKIDQYLSTIKTRYFQKLEIEINQFLINYIITDDVKIIKPFKNNYVYKQINNEDDFIAVKKELTYDYFNEHPKMLASNWEGNIPNVHFCPFLSTKIISSTEYQIELNTNMSLFIKYIPKVTGITNYKNQKKTLLFNNGMEFILFRPMMYTNNNNEFIYNYLFLYEKQFIEISPIVDYDNWLSSLPFVLNCLINEYYINIEIISVDNIVSVI